MSTYIVFASVTVSAYTTVEADSEAEAIKIADNRSVELSTSFGPTEQSRDSFVVEEADGEPFDLRAEPVGGKS
jgi:hypothetical protein